MVYEDDNEEDLAENESANYTWRGMIQIVFTSAVVMMIVIVVMQNIIVYNVH